MKQNKLLSIFIVFFWILGSNLPVTEALFTSLHDLVEHHHDVDFDFDVDSSGGKHTHHSDFHTCHGLGHKLAHENDAHHNESLPKHQPLDDCCIKTIAIICSTTVQKDKYYPNTYFPIAFPPFSQSVSYQSVFTISNSNSIVPPIIDWISVSTPRAPPFLI